MFSNYKIYTTFQRLIMKKCKIFYRVLYCYMLKRHYFGYVMLNEINSVSLLFKNRARKLKITYTNHIILLLYSAVLQSGI